VLRKKHTQGGAMKQYAVEVVHDTSFGEQKHICNGFPDLEAAEFHAEQFRDRGYEAVVVEV